MSTDKTKTGAPAATLGRLGENPRLQSPYLYLQAAGSDGGDETSPGVHLRWDFQHALGDQHLPKGKLAAPGGPYETEIGFNRDDDYVRLYRAPYDAKLFAVSADLGKVTGGIEESGVRRAWRYTGLFPIPGDSSETVVELRFTDLLLYDLVRAQVDPAVDAREFLRRYEGTLEVEAVGKHLLRACLSFTPDRKHEAPGEPWARAEAITPRDRRNGGDPYVACRREVHPETERETICFACEDVRYLRLRCWRCVPVGVELQTYEDYTLGVALGPPGPWKPVAELSLSLDDGRVLDRLANAPADDVDRRWPRFNDTDGTGAFTVSVPNYKDRWYRPDGLRAAVERYLELSRTDVKASETLTDPATAPNDAAVETSYLDTLNVVGLDFHVARMLELGHIDPEPGVASTPHVYLAEYVTEAPLEPGEGEGEERPWVTHYYLAPPVTWADYRLPPAPVLRAPRYGLWHQPVENEPPRLLTDAAGYARTTPSRYVNLDREPYETETSPLPPFWSGGPDHCGCASTLPVLYGVEYRRLGEPEWRRPEASHDPDYTDPAGLPETVPIPEQGANPVFTHVETEEGEHEYALYAVNWFSRVSPPGNVVQTDFTHFDVLRALKPPAGFAVQLVQPESPLVFTTRDEQERLAALPGPDRTLVRVSFDWDQVHNAAYQFADRVELFFRQRLPEAIQGLVSTAAGNLAVLPDHRVRVRTAPQTVASQVPPLVRQPFLLPAQEPRYAGGAFTTEGRTYVVDDLEFPDPTGNNPTFVVRQVRQTAALAGPQPDEFVTTESWVGPTATGVPFVAVENLGREANWDCRLARTVYLEPFHEVFGVSVHGSAGNDRAYTVRSVALVGTQTRVTVRETVGSSAAPLGNLLYRRRARVVGVSPGAAQFRVEGDLAAGPGGLAVGAQLRVYGAPQNAGTYTVTSVSAAAGETVIGVTPAPASSTASGWLDYPKVLPITAVYPGNRIFAVAGDRRAELAPPRYETRTEDDGTVTEWVVGGLSGAATITELEDVDADGNPVPGSHTGVFEIAFASLVLRDHVDPGVEWHRGTVRVMEDAALFPPVGDPAYRAPEMKVLNVWETDRSGATLRLVAFDPTFDPAFDPSGSHDPRAGYMPIRQGAGVDANVHPGYRLYLLADTSGGNNFQASVLLPAPGEESRKTVMAARSADSSVPGAYSPLTPPAVLLAQEIRDPVPPGIPTGPLFATRPDFYGKATYTFDVEVGTPYALVFSRGTDRGILDALYKQSTVAQILAGLAALPGPDAAFANDRWQDLANAVTDATGHFPQYIPGGYRFPVPDNDRYVLPHENPAVVVRPFQAGNVPPGSIPGAVRAAIEGSFVPLTERPLLFAQMDPGTTTSRRAPVLRDAAGDPLAPGDPAYDPSPMAVRLPGGGKVRFTDYALDGASAARYFYFAVELSNRMQRSDRSPVAGPVTLVNSSPPQPPEIRSVHVRTPDPVVGRTTAVVFTLNDYLPSERVERFQVYRATSTAQALGVRGMELVKTVKAGEEVADDFAGLEFPLFGQPLFYRVVALRRFLNEEGREEWAPSFPSEVREIRVIDTVVPPAPELAYAFGTPLPGSPVRFPDVVLSWNRTAWNPRYHVFKMNALGNWVKVHTLESNAPVVTLDLAATDLGTNVLPKQNDAGRTLYHRFKVVTENSSGLLSKADRPLTI
jgi:hypothetical protein